MPPVGYYVWSKGSERTILPDGENERQKRIDELGRALIQCREIRMVITPDPHITDKFTRAIDDVCDEMYSRLLDEIKQRGEQ